MEHPLDGIQAKLDRASEHLEAIRSEGTAFLDEGKPYEFVGEFQTERNAWIVRVKVNQAPPLHLGVLLGDWAHNMRSALDHLAYALTVLDGGKPNRRTQFPIANVKEDFPVMAKRHIPALTESHRARVQSAQPHQAGKAFDTHPLYWLAELSNADKHRVVHPTYAHVVSDDERKFVRGLQIDSPRPAKRIAVTGPGRRMEDGAELLIVEFDPFDGPPGEVHVKGRFTLGIAFGEGAISWTSLPSVSEYVVKIIEAFMPDFPEWEPPERS